MEPSKRYYHQSTQSFSEQADNAGPDINPEVIRSIHLRVQEYSDRVQQARKENPSASFLSELNSEEQKDLASCYNNLGFYCLQKLQKPKEALFYFLQSIQFNFNNDPIILFNAASLFEREGKKPEAAAELYMRAIRMDPYFIDAKVHLARILASHETEDSARFRGAEFLLRDLYETHNYVGAALELALLYSRKAEHSEEYFQKMFLLLDEVFAVIAEEPNYVVDYKEMEVYAPEEYSVQLVKTLDNYMAGFTTTEDGQNVLSELPPRSEFSKMELADVSYRFRSEDSERVIIADVLNVKAYLLKQMKRERDAKALYDQVIRVMEIKEDSKDANIVDSTTLQATSSLSEEILRKAMEKVPTEEKARIYMNCAILNNGMGEVDESIRLLEKAFDLTKGKDVQVLACMALYMQEKNPQVSELLFKRVISLEPTQFEHYIAYSSFLHHQSRTKDAINLLERTIKKYPDMKEQLEKQIELIRGISSGSSNNNFSDLFGSNFGV